MVDSTTPPRRLARRRGSELMNGPRVDHLPPREQWRLAWRYARRLARWVNSGREEDRPPEHGNRTRQFTARWDNNDAASFAMDCLFRRVRSSLDSPASTYLRHFLWQYKNNRPIDREYLHTIVKAWRAKRARRRALKLTTTTSANPNHDAA